MSYHPAIIADYRTDLTTLSDKDLWSFKYRNQGRGQTMGEISTCRGNVKKANVELRRRGLLKDAKGLQLTKDATGFVKAAIAPLKAAAVDHAEEEALAYVARVVAQFAGKDLNVVAPRPNSKMHRDEYRRAQSRRNAITAVLKVSYKGHRYADPELLSRDAELEAKFVANEKLAAGVSFDAYVAKLEGKVGQGVTGATVEGKYLWQGSILTVTKGTEVTRWKTQQIINYSVLGNAYNQWPTRVVK